MDVVQERLAAHAHALVADEMPTSSMHPGCVRVSDTPGAVMGRFDDDCNRIARAVVCDTTQMRGSTMLGTALKVPLDMAAFVNDAAARSADIKDVYHALGAKDDHPSHVTTPLLAVAETTHTNGRDFLSTVVLAYEIYLRFANGFGNRVFDAPTFAASQWLLPVKS